MQEIQSKGGMMDNYFNQKANEKTVEAELVDVPNLVRSANSGDKIYFVKGNEKHWVTSPEVLKALGFEFGQEKEIDKNTMAALTSGEPIRMENVNEYILPVEEKVVEEVKEEIIEGTDEVNNTPVEGYFSVIIPCVLTAENVTRLTDYVAELQVYFSGEIISVVQNTIDYRGYSPKFGNKVIECEDLKEGVERAYRVAKGRALLADELT